MAGVRGVCHAAGGGCKQLGDGQQDRSLPHPEGHPKETWGLRPFTGIVACVVALHVGQGKVVGMDLEVSKAVSDLA